MLHRLPVRTFAEHRTAILAAAQKQGHPTVRVHVVRSGHHWMRQNFECEACRKTATLDTMPHREGHCLRGHLTKKPCKVSNIETLMEEVRQAEAAGHRFQHRRKISHTTKLP